MFDMCSGGQIINLYTTGSINSPSMSINHQTISSSSSSNQQCQSTSSSSSIAQSTTNTSSSAPTSPSPSLSSTSTSTFSQFTHRKLTNFTIESILDNNINNTSNINISHNNNTNHKVIATTKGSININGPKKSNQLTTSSKARRHKFCHRNQESNIDNLNNISNSNRFNSSTNRGPRIPFTSYQVQILESKFASTNYLSSYEVWSLSEQLDISENRVKIWFQNRRARRKREERSPNIVDNQAPNHQVNMNTDCEHQYLTNNVKMSQ